MCAHNASVVLPIWSGRLGVLNSFVCGVLGLLCALAMVWFVDRGVVVPACKSYGSSHAMTYVDYKIYSSRRHESAACIFKASGVEAHDISFREATSYQTDLWVGIVFSLELTVPAFILLFALGRTLICAIGMHWQAPGSKSSKTGR